MILSDERQSHLAHVVTDGIWNDDLVEYSDEDRAVRVARQAVGRFVKAITDIDKMVEQKIASLRRGVVEGSPEWDVLYSKYFEEEIKRRGKD